MLDCIRHFFNRITVRRVRRLAGEVHYAKLIPCSPIANQGAFHRCFQHAFRANFPQEAFGRGVKCAHRFFARPLLFHSTAIGVQCGLSVLQQLRQVKRVVLVGNSLRSRQRPGYGFGQQYLSDLKAGVLVYSTLLELGIGHHLEEPAS
mgnify:CR=1 FL=1